MVYCFTHHEYHTGKGRKTACLIHRLSRGGISFPQVLRNLGITDRRFGIRKEDLPRR